MRLAAVRLAAARWQLHPRSGLHGRCEYIDHCTRRSRVVEAVKGGMGALRTVVDASVDDLVVELI